MRKSSPSFETSNFKIVPEANVSSVLNVYTGRFLSLSNIKNELNPNNVPAQRVSPLSSEPIITGTKRMFYHGVDRETIDNPTLFNIGTGLTRDDHIVRITRLPNAEAQAGTLLGFNSFFIFDKDRNLPPTSDIKNI